MALLTRSGRSIGLLGLTSHLLGWQFGWNELMVTAAACWTVLAIAGGFVVGRLRVDVVRTVDAERVMAGTLARSALTLTNPGRRPLGSRRLEERGTHPSVIELDGLAAGESRTVTTVLETSRRGVVEVGPTVVTRTDPFGLLRREVRQTGIDRVIVHPRSVAVAPLPVGFAKDLEGPTSDTSPAGNVSFHAVREYETGDDHRHIHWLSTARTGTLMVRHYVDNRRPCLTGVLDDRLADPDAYECAVEVMASLAAASRTASHPVYLWIGRRAVPAPLDDALDSLTFATPRGDELGPAVDHALAAAPDTSVLVIVTGDRPAVELTAVVASVRHRLHVVIVRCGRLEPLTIPGAVTHTVDSLESFRAAWDRAVR